MEVMEGWSGPGRQDTRIEPLPLSEDGLHIDLGKRGLYEWWYFDAHLDSGHTIVVFFHASNPNPGMQGKPGIEIVLLRPDGVRIQKFFPYNRSQFSAARDKPDVTIGENTLQVKKWDDELPIYEIDVKEKDLGCHLKYTAEVNGWKPGSGHSQFGDLGFFAWVIPFARLLSRGRSQRVTGPSRFQVSDITITIGWTSPFNPLSSTGCGGEYTQKTSPLLMPTSNAMTKWITML
jgi:hypothetical protein